MARSFEFKNRNIKLSGPKGPNEIQFLKGEVRDGLSKLTEVTVEFMSDKSTTKPEDFLGERFSIAIDLEDDSKRYFAGFCTTIEYGGYHLGLHRFIAELRPWLWFLTRVEDHRIFQEKTVVEIIQEVLTDHGFSGDIENKLNGTYPTRVYCVQYRETDFAFISRLMEEEGIYYFFDEKESATKMVLCDGISSHSDLPGAELLDFFEPDNDFRRDDDHIWRVTSNENVRSGKVTLNEYEFEKPKADQKKVKELPSGDHSHKKYEIYRYPGHIREPMDGDTIVRVRMEAEKAKHRRFNAEGNVRRMAVGGLFTLQEHYVSDYNKQFLVLEATHILQSQEMIDTLREERQSQKAPNEPDADGTEINYDTYRSSFEVMRDDVQFRAPLVTPWPEIAGLQTATVTGPSGEEIHTDKYGRIKVQFHWDRDGQNDEKTTCWVRVAMPWTGKKWGMISIPRIGNEVVIQFEEGDPDRPICTGMIYNADNMPPYALPDNKTQTGIVTRSSKSGSSDTFNELIFEDKKDAEFVRLQSERDYKETIKNNAEITIGLEHQDPGDLTQTIYHTKTEKIQTGDHIFKVEKGNQNVFVKTDHDCTIEGKSTTEITGDTVMTVSQGDYTQTVSSGNVTRKVEGGSETHTISTGNWTVEVSSGSISIEAAMEISLQVGGSSIVIDPSGITIAGPMITVSGDATVDVGSPSTTVSGDGLLTLSGGSTMIN